VEQYTETPIVPYHISSHFALIFSLFVINPASIPNKSWILRNLLSSPFWMTIGALDCSFGWTKKRVKKERN